MGDEVDRPYYVGSGVEGRNRQTVPSSKTFRI